MVEIPLHKFLNILNATRNSDRMNCNVFTKKSSEKNKTESFSTITPIQEKRSKQENSIVASNLRIVKNNLPKANTFRSETISNAKKIVFKPNRKESKPKGFINTKNYTLHTSKIKTSEKKQHENVNFVNVNNNFKDNKQKVIAQGFDKMPNSTEVKKARNENPHNRKSYKPARTNEKPPIIKVVDKNQDVINEKNINKNQQKCKILTENTTKQSILEKVDKKQIKDINSYIKTHKINFTSLSRYRYFYGFEVDDVDKVRIFQNSNSEIHNTNNIIIKKKEHNKNMNVAVPVYLDDKDKNAKISYKPEFDKISENQKKNKSDENSIQIKDSDQKVNIKKDVICNEFKMSQKNATIAIDKMFTKNNTNVLCLQQNNLKNTKKTLKTIEVVNKPAETELNKSKTIPKNLNITKTVNNNGKYVKKINKKFSISKQSDNQITLYTNQFQKPEIIKTKFVNKVEESFFLQLVCMRQIYDFLIKLCCLYVYGYFYDFNFFEIKTPTDLIYNAIIENDGVISVKNFTSRYNRIFMKSLRWFCDSNIAGEMKEKFLDCISASYRKQKFLFYLKNNSFKSKYKLEQLKKTVISKNLRIHLRNWVERISFNFLYSKNMLLKRHRINKNPLFPALIDKKVFKQQIKINKEKISEFGHSLFVRLQISVIIYYIHSPITKCLTHSEIKDDLNSKDTKSQAKKIKKTKRNFIVISKSDCKTHDSKFYFDANEIKNNNSKFTISSDKKSFTEMLKFFVFYEDRNIINKRCIEYFCISQKEIKNIFCKFTNLNRNTTNNTILKEFTNLENIKIIEKRDSLQLNATPTPNLKPIADENDNFTENIDINMNEIILANNNKANKKLPDNVDVPKNNRKYKNTISFNKKNTYKGSKSSSKKSRRHKKSNRKISTVFKIGFCLMVVAIVVSGIFID
ncbi:hypothetical protein EDEG_03248 [Edhazardia aedis USNM 41457]|uniref:Uncharacterized protein n=1 Tax=Edhazardia aedis (strain USNM 41457) TaxID=1003232 RepID=J9DI61_EDHAE|nr:hypothetical protein EDEG_03248 [Edhazardia aedis USNM 41457]|eukprot:EJW02315.1 hypothetical protein EDEG_03248 [Edhazardia aedis USNM 41457]